MIRSAFAACLGAAFGAVAYLPVQERVADRLMHPVEAWSVVLVAITAGLVWLLIMACREPARRGGHQPCSCGEGRPKPPTSGSAVTPPRGADGRFRKGRS
ncbi:hypothetical protein [Methylobacterium sp. A54F]